MSMYATADDVQDGFRQMNEEERTKSEALLEEAAVIIDAFAADAPADKKKVVSCRMVRRAIGDGGNVSFPMGATQGSASALGYTQSWTISNGASGELYLARLEKQMLGYGNRIGSYSPVEEMVEK